MVVVVREGRGWSNRGREREEEGVEGKMSRSGAGVRIHSTTSRVLVSLVFILFLAFLFSASYSTRVSFSLILFFSLPFPPPACPAFPAFFFTWLHKVPDGPCCFVWIGSNKPMRNYSHAISRSD